MNQNWRTLFYQGAVDFQNIGDFLFSEKTIKDVSNEISKILFESKKLNIIVANNVIINVINQYYSNFIPDESGNMYSQFVQEKIASDDVEKILNQSINFIVQTILLEEEQQKVNSNISIWNDPRRNWYDTIKIKERRTISYVPIGQPGQIFPSLPLQNIE